MGGIVYYKFKKFAIKVKLCRLNVMQVYRWSIASVRHFAGGAQHRPYRPVSQEFMHYT